MGVSEKRRHPGPRLAPDLAAADVDRVRTYLLLAYLAILAGFVLVTWTRGDLADWIVQP